MNAVLRGAWFVATNRDPIYPAEDGLLAGAGSMVAAVAPGPPAASRTWWSASPSRRCSSRRPPSAGVPVQDAVVIGDSLVTDIRAAQPGRRPVGADAHRRDDARPPGSRRGAGRSADAIAHDAAELERGLERLAAAKP